MFKAQPLEGGLLFISGSGEGMFFVSGLEKLFIGTNTKMTKTIEETYSFVTELERLVEYLPQEKCQLFVIPSYTAIEKAKKSASKIWIGAQNMCWADEGQFTGEISPRMLKEVGCDIIEIGHSERRHVLGETDAQENLKVLAALSHGFTTLLCIGETNEQKAFGLSDEVLRTQLKIGLHGVLKNDVKNLWVAYEPVWAIGVSGVPATKEYVEAKHAVIKDMLGELFGYDNKVPVLYGGSVNNNNATEFIETPGVDGLFIGRSAWDAQNFSKIIHDVLSIFLQRAEA
jgi:triosephosphate isomerase